jgi:adenylate kinase
MKILLIGPQGSGKSTQGKFLAEYLKIPYISTGDIFRNIATQDSDEGKRIKQILESGQLVDDETTIDLTKKRLQQEDCGNGFILDGVPRTIAQEENLGVSFDKVLYLKVLKEVVLERLLKRGRQDDTEDLINKRLDLYFNQTESLLDLFRQKGILVEIDATGDIQTVQDEITKSI